MEAAGAPQYVLPATRYPGVGPRAVATVIDAILGFLVIGIPVLILFGHHTTVNTTGGTTSSYSTSDPKVLALLGALAIAYYALFESWVAATPGKLVLGLRVRGADGSKVSTRAALIRNILRLVDAFPYLLPYLVAAIAVWSDGPLPAQSDMMGRRRRVGDRVAGTIVVYR